MFLLVDKTTRQILLSSARPIDLNQSPTYANAFLVEIPDDEYSADMVGGILHDE